MGAAMALGMLFGVGLLASQSRTPARTPAAASHDTAPTSTPSTSGRWVRLLEGLTGQINEPPQGRGHAHFRVTQGGVEVYRGRYADSWQWTGEHGGGQLEWWDGEGAPPAAASASVGGRSAWARARMR